MVSKLGKYSNDPADHEQELRNARRETVYEIGDYLLRMHPNWTMYAPERKDGKPVPPALAGLWTGPQDFAVKLAHYDNIRRKGDGDAASS